jgi:predicted membrane channel-forming protein YqfA (hemolysin III family)
MWALLILFFFVRHMEKDAEMWIKLVGALTSLVAVVQYNAIADYMVRFTGSGSSETIFVLFGIGGFAVFLSSFLWPKRNKDKKSTQDDTSLPLEESL